LPAVPAKPPSLYITELTSLTTTHWTRPMRLRFTKMSGAGNDFIVIDNMTRSTRLPEERIRELCTRRTGVGADGLIMIEPSATYDFTMKYYNADGRLGSMCGNGGRCAVYFAYTIGVAGRSTVFEANTNRYDAEVTGDSMVRLNMTDPDDFRDTFEACGYPCHFVDTGSPHTLIVTDNVDSFDVEGIGRAIRNNTELFPEGTNVNFAQVTSPSTIILRTFERGVEAETLACGTGAVASAILCRKLGLLDSCSVGVTVRSGDRLQVDFSQEFRDVYLSGPAKIIFSGEVDM